MVIKFNGFIYDLTEKDAVKCLQEEINKMYAENEKLRSVENLETITENILLKQSQNQKAIECLREVWKDFEKRLFTKKWDDKVYVAQICNMINHIFDNKIKELEEK